MDRLKALSVSRCQRTVINITPPTIRRKFTMPSRSRSNTYHRPHHPPLIPAQAPIPRSSQADIRSLNAGKVYSFYPPEFEDYGPHRLLKGFHVGRFTAYCPLSQTFDSYVCRDYGQYPWGHSPFRGAMAVLCRKLGILYGSNVENTCLPLHVLTGLIDNDVIEIDDIVSKHYNFVKGLLNSRAMRDGLFQSLGDTLWPIFLRKTWHLLFFLHLY